MFKIVICDDEQVSADYLIKMITSKFTLPYTIDVCKSGEELHTYISKAEKAIDVLLMDIKLEKENGIEVASIIKKRCPDLKVIFVTGYREEYVENIFLSIKPFGILGKPVDGNILISLLNQAYKLREEEHPHTLSIKFKNTISQIVIDEIRYIESIRRRVYIYTESGSECFYGTLNELEDKLPDYFLRCHKSFLVNMKKIEHYNGNEIVLYSGERISVSRNKNNESRDKYLLFVGKEL